MNQHKNSNASKILYPPIYTLNTKKSYEESNSFIVLNASMKKYLDKNKNHTINEKEGNGNIFHFNVDNKFFMNLDKPNNLNMNSEKYYVDNKLIRCNNKNDINDINLINNRNDKYNINDEVNLNYLPCNSLINTHNNCVNKYNNNNNNVNEKKDILRNIKEPFYYFLKENKIKEDKNIISKSYVVDSLSHVNSYMNPYNSSSFCNYDNVENKKTRGRSLSYVNNMGMYVHNNFESKEDKNDNTTEYFLKKSNITNDHMINNNINKYNHDDNNNKYNYDNNRQYLFRNNLQKMLYAKNISNSEKNDKKKYSSIIYIKHQDTQKNNKKYNNLPVIDIKDINMNERQNDILKINKKNICKVMDNNNMTKNIIYKHNQTNEIKNCSINRLMLLTHNNEKLNNIFEKVDEKKNYHENYYTNYINSNYNVKSKYRYNNIKKIISSNNIQNNHLVMNNKDFVDAIKTKGNTYCDINKLCRDNSKEYENKKIRPIREDKTIHKMEERYLLNKNKNNFSKNMINNYNGFYSKSGKICTNKENRNFFDGTFDMKSKIYKKKEDEYNIKKDSGIIISDNNNNICVDKKYTENSKGYNVRNDEHNYMKYYNDNNTIITKKDHYIVNNVLDNKSKNNEGINHVNIKTVMLSNDDNYKNDLKKQNSIKYDKENNKYVFYKDDKSVMKNIMNHINKLDNENKYVDNENIYVDNENIYVDNEKGNKIMELMEKKFNLSNDIEKYTKEYINNMDVEKNTTQQNNNINYTSIKYDDICISNNNINNKNVRNVDSIILENKQNFNLHNMNVVHKVNDIISVQTEENNDRSNNNDSNINNKNNNYYNYHNYGNRIHVKNDVERNKLLLVKHNDNIKKNINYLYNSKKENFENNKEKNVSLVIKSDPLFLKTVKNDDSNIDFMKNIKKNDINNKCVDKDNLNYTCYNKKKKIGTSPVVINNIRNNCIIKNDEEKNENKEGQTHFDIFYLNKLSMNVKEEKKKRKKEKRRKTKKMKHTIKLLKKKNKEDNLLLNKILKKNMYENHMVDEICANNKQIENGEEENNYHIESKNENIKYDEYKGNVSNIDSLIIKTLCDNNQKMDDVFYVSQIDCPNEMYDKIDNNMDKDKNYGNNNFMSNKKEIISKKDNEKINDIILHDNNNCNNNNNNDDDDHGDFSNSYNIKDIHCSYEEKKKLNTENNWTVNTTKDDNLKCQHYYKNKEEYYVQINKEKVNQNKYIHNNIDNSFLTTNNISNVISLPWNKDKVVKIHLKNKCKESNKESKKDVITINTKLSRYERVLIHTCIYKLNWKKYIDNINKGMFYWIGYNINDFDHYNYMKKKKVINRIPSMYMYTKKKTLTFLLSHLSLIFPSLFNFYPNTFVLPENKNLIKYILNSNNKEYYIMKPDCGSMGIGVKIINKYNDININILNGYNSYIIQKYIDNPLLMYKKKFDFRIYILLLPGKNYPKIYLSKVGFARLCTEEYKKKKRYICNTYIHLTNYSINKDNDKYIRKKNIHDKNNNKQLLSDVFIYLKRNGYDIDDIWTQIKKITCLTSLAIYSYIKEKIKYNFHNNFYFYQLIGLDILLDNNGKAWLLEVNSNPSLRIDYIDPNYAQFEIQLESMFDRYVKEPVISEMFLIVYEKIYKKYIKKKNKKSNNVMIQKGKFEKCRNKNDISYDNKKNRISSKGHLNNITNNNISNKNICNSNGSVSGLSNFRSNKKNEKVKLSTKGKQHTNKNNHFNEFSLYSEDKYCIEKKKTKNLSNGYKNMGSKLNIRNNTESNISSMCNVSSRSNISSVTNTTNISYISKNQNREVNIFNYTKKNYPSSDSEKSSTYNFNKNISPNNYLNNIRMKNMLKKKSKVKKNLFLKKEYMSNVDTCVDENDIGSFTLSNNLNKREQNSNDSLNDKNEINAIHNLKEVNSNKLSNKNLNDIKYEDNIQNVVQDNLDDDEKKKEFHKILYDDIVCSKKNLDINKYNDKKKYNKDLNFVKIKRNDINDDYSYEYKENIQKHHDILDCLDHKSDVIYSGEENMFDNYSDIEKGSRYINKNIRNMPSNEYNNDIYNYNKDNDMNDEEELFQSNILNKETYVQIDNHEDIQLEKFLTNDIETYKSLYRNISDNIFKKKIENLIMIRSNLYKYMNCLNVLGIRYINNNDIKNIDDLYNKNISLDFKRSYTKIRKDVLHPLKNDVLEKNIYINLKKETKKYYSEMKIYNNCYILFDFILNKYDNNLKKNKKKLEYYMDKNTFLCMCTDIKINNIIDNVYIPNNSTYNTCFDINKGSNENQIFQIVKDLLYNQYLDRNKKNKVDKEERSSFESSVNKNIQLENSSDITNGSIYDHKFYSLKNIQDPKKTKDQFINNVHSDISSRSGKIVRPNGKYNNSEKVSDILTTQINIYKDDNINNENNNNNNNNNIYNDNINNDGTSFLTNNYMNSTCVTFCPFTLIPNCNNIVNFNTIGLSSTKYKSKRKKKMNIYDLEYLFNRQVFFSKYINKNQGLTLIDFFLLMQAISLLIFPYISHLCIYNTIYPYKKDFFDKLNNQENNIFSNIYSDVGNIKNDRKKINICVYNKKVQDEKIMNESNLISEKIKKKKKKGDFICEYDMSLNNKFHVHKNIIHNKDDFLWHRNICSNIYNLYEYIQMCINPNVKNICLETFLIYIFNKYGLTCNL
ncbi:tubulin--tyrosine ligase, putative [Plasmodium sp. gorilla clade G2]|uniref:tubulin--tyrosine ligase, putative n=1 Tax=Plasmodium sp. gorilla clade G2 TaxID=880535 RepID=UPI000D223B8E|nr:tubulin--tyrosine ligase, putative [Plasmodium sp. gorilla clade G2]SOV16140.1 tubulin--tyrosine ligase, putative [Plasmodium sp. gorilla clade G2]